MNFRAKVDWKYGVLDSDERFYVEDVFQKPLKFYETRSFLCACIEIIKSHFSLQRDKKVIIITTIKQKNSTEFIYLFKLIYSPVF